jgi:hypothetical protein
LKNAINTISKISPVPSFQRGVKVPLFKGGFRGILKRFMKFPQPPFAKGGLKLIALVFGY